ncbi:MAG TPA: sulfotransferase [Acidimicrobiia bacterium]|nr:sulfotransferase [Acidimicrobiia bacterium]
MTALRRAAGAFDPGRAADRFDPGRAADGFDPGRSAAGGGPCVLVAGLPRSGTTWVGEVLGRTSGARYLHEPDNHLVRPDAWSAKRRLGPYPELQPGDAADEYERLWARAFTGGPDLSALYTSARILQHAGATRLSGRLAGFAVRVGDFTGRPTGSRVRRRRVGGAPGPLVVKSVHCARSLEWVADRFDPAVVVVERHPFGVISSWRKLGWDDFLDSDHGALRYSAAVLGVDPPPRSAPWLERAAWHYGVLSSYLERARRRHPEWLVVRHEVLCTDPEPAFRRLSARLGLHFTDETARFLAASNRPGDGYSTHRLWHEQTDGGRSRLTPTERTLVLATLDRFTGALPVPTSPLSRPAAATGVVQPSPGIVPEPSTRAGPVRAADRLTAALAPYTGGAEPRSEKEAHVLRVLHSWGLPPPVTQYVIRDENGRFLAKVDFAWPAWRFGLEYYGDEFHSPRAWARDDRRLARIEAMAWRIEESDRFDLRPSSARLRTLLTGVLNQTPAFPGPFVTTVTDP